MARESTPLTPESYAAKGTEHAHQVALYMWIALEGKALHPELGLLFAIPNGGQRSPIVARKLKMEGVKPGVSDLFLPVARGGCHGLFIEMKKPKGKASADQLEFGAKVQAQGFGFVVTDSWDKARDILLSYLGTQTPA